MTILQRTTALQPSQPTCGSRLIAGNVELQRRVVNFLQARGVQGASSLQVEAYGGTVIIRGRLASADAKRLCGDCCRRVAGVSMLVDEVEVCDDASSAKTAL
jgi:hypothetical protein